MKELLKDKEKTNSKAPLLEVDLSTAYCFEDEIDRILGRVKEASLYQPNLIYSAFNGEEINKVRTKGIYTQIIAKPGSFFGNTEENLKDINDTALNYITDFKKRALALYDGNLVDPGKITTPCLFRFKAGVEPLDALLGVLKLKYGNGKFPF